MLDDNLVNNLFLNKIFIWLNFRIESYLHNQYLKNSNNLHRNGTILNTINIPVIRSFKLFQKCVFIKIDTDIPGIFIASV